MDESTLAAAVARGAALLDRKRPGWESEIDIAKLDIASTDRCITAQLSGENDYRVGMDRLGIGSYEEYVGLGFAADIVAGESNYADYRTLTDLWRALIEERLLTEDIADV